MSRPLLISDCDEVLLHMVRHFSDWLGETREIDYRYAGFDDPNSIRYRASGDIVEREHVYALFNDFFEAEMHRQTLTPGVLEALETIDAIADIVILTNLGDRHREGRIAQLDVHGIRHRVICNQGGKGGPVKTLVDEYKPSVAVFVDDIANHHQSVADNAPEVWRLHMVAEPELASVIPPAPAAHVRIDRWNEATPWILDRFARKPL